MTRELSGELDYRIRYDVEHDLFHAQNVFNDEYIKPTFIEYVQTLEKENAELKEKVENLQKYLDTQNSYRECAETWLKLTKAKDLLERWLKLYNTNTVKGIIEDTGKYLKEIKK